ncbi:MAG: membrane protein insertase YidC [Acidobacteriota bacterium]|nr:membrane protein insertase YidC [Acidobacteriota bacterium]
MEKRLFLAAGLSLGILLLWEGVVAKRVLPPPRPAAATAVAPAAEPTALTAGTPASAAEAVPPAPAPGSVEPVAATAEQTAVLENSLVRATFSNRGGVLVSYLLVQHQDEQKNPLELVKQLPAPAPRPFALEFPGHPELTDKAAKVLFAVEKPDARTLRFRFSDGALAITKEVTLGTGYLLDFSTSVPGATYAVAVGTGLRNAGAEESSRYAPPAAALATSGGGFERANADKLAKPKSFPIDPKGFAGLEDNYFLAAFLPAQPATAVIRAVGLPDVDGKKPAAAPTVEVTASGNLAGKAYFGPKDVEILEGTHLGLEKTVDFGWYGILARPLLWLLKRTYGWVGNYGVAILLVTLAIRILLFPLMHKSYASMKKMQKLAPKMNAIRDKYKKAKTDPAQRQKMNDEIMKLYQAEGYNPMSGCFPILLQLPILVAFYNVLSRSIELRHAPFVLWIRDLSAVDHTYVLLILMIISMYVQQAMTPSTADPTQKKIFMAMPLLWGFFLKDMPSGLVLYWLFSNLLTVLQQVIINKIPGGDAPAPEPKKLRQARA